MTPVERILSSEVERMMSEQARIIAICADVLSPGNENLLNHDAPACVADVVTMLTMQEPTS